VDSVYLTCILDGLVVVASVEIHPERRPVLYRSPTTLSADHLIPLGRLIDLTLPDQRFADLRRIIAVEVLGGGIHQPLSSLSRSGLVGERSSEARRVG